MSVLTRLAGLDGVVSAAKGGDWERMLAELSPVVRRFAGDRAAEGYVKWRTGVMLKLYPPMRSEYAEWTSREQGTDGPRNHPGLVNPDLDLPPLFREPPAREPRSPSPANVLPEATQAEGSKRSKGYDSVCVRCGRKFDKITQSDDGVCALCIVVHQDDVVVEDFMGSRARMTMKNAKIVRGPSGGNEVRESGAFSEEGQGS